MIQDFENSLRKIIINILGENIDLYKVPPDRKVKWKEKLEVEKKKYKGVLLEKRLIFFSDFYDLKTIIIKDWEKFKPIFHDKKRFEVFYSEIENYRNTISHGRNLTKSQEDLLSGITSDLKNMITVYHNKNEMKEDFFVRINTISDNLGNTWPGNSKKPILRVGDYYELTIDAVDPKDREIEYQLTTYKGVFIKFQKANRFSFTIDNTFVGKDTSLIIQVRTPDSDYENKDGKVIRATILPQ